LHYFNPDISSADHDKELVWGANIQDKAGVMKWAGMKKWHGRDKGRLPSFYLKAG